MTLGTGPNPWYLLRSSRQGAAWSRRDRGCEGPHRRAACGRHRAGGGDVRARGVAALSLGWVAGSTALAVALAAARANWRVERDSGSEILHLATRAHANGGEFGTAAVGWHLVKERGGTHSERDLLAEAHALSGVVPSAPPGRPTGPSPQPPTRPTASTALQEWARVRARQGRQGDARTAQGVVGGVPRREHGGAGHRLFFHPTIKSHTSAIGLMQVMSATGRLLARATRVRDITTETLRNAEINVHLGLWFLAGLFEHYDDDIVLFLSAYKSGSTRANRWRHMPEAADTERFTERIPLAKTRSYVEKVTRNRALHCWFYGDGAALGRP